MRSSWNTRELLSWSLGQERLGRSNYRPSSPCTEFILVAKIIALDRLKTLWLCTASARYWYYLLLKNKNVINSKSKETCIKALNNTCVFLLNFLITETLLGDSSVNSEPMDCVLQLLQRSDWRQTARRNLNLKGCMFLPATVPSVCSWASNTLKLYPDDWFQYGFVLQSLLIFFPIPASRRKYNPPITLGWISIISQY